MSVADLRPQSPRLTLTLRHPVGANDAKATVFWRCCERAAPVQSLSLMTPGASPDSRRYQKLQSIIRKIFLPGRSKNISSLDPTVSTFIARWRDQESRSGTWRKPGSGG